MPIKKTVVADNGMPISYHKAVRLEVHFATGMGTLEVQSHVNEEAAAARLPIAAAWYVSIAPGNVDGIDIEAIETFLISPGGQFAGGLIVSDVSLSLDAARSRQVKLINQARLTANRSSFIYAGKSIACDELSRSDIDATNGLVALTGNMPVGWVGGWKAADNTYVAIPDVTAWKTFYSAMVAQGLANFGKAQALKADVAAAKTIEEIEAIVW